MPRRGFTLKLRPLVVLPEGKLDLIHQAVLDVLRETGVRMESPWALEFLAGHGCRVDRESQRVRFPAELVEACWPRPPGLLSAARPTQRMTC